MMFLMSFCHILSMLTCLFHFTHFETLKYLCVVGGGGTLGGHTLNSIERHFLGVICFLKQANTIIYKHNPEGIIVA